jgi:hypothetical protein
LKQVELAKKESIVLLLFYKIGGFTPFIKFQDEGKRVHVPPDEKTCGHAAYTGSSHTFSINRQLIKIYVFPEISSKCGTL